MTWTGVDICSQKAMKGQILVNNVLKEGEIIHISQCRAVGTLT